MVKWYIYIYIVTCANSHSENVIETCLHYCDLCLAIYSNKE